MIMTAHLTKVTTDEVIGHLDQIFGYRAFSNIHQPVIT